MSESILTTIQAGTVAALATPVGVELAANPLDSPDEGAIALVVGDQGVATSPTISLLSLDLLGIARDDLVVAALPTWLDEMAEMPATPAEEVAAPTLALAAPFGGVGEATSLQATSPGLIVTAVIAVSSLRRWRKGWWLSRDRRRPDPATIFPRSMM